MSNIHREVGFFDSLTPRFGIDLARRPTATAAVGEAGKLEGALMRTNTRAYVSLLVATGAEANRNGGGMEEGLVLLWAMEKVCPSFLFSRSLSSFLPSSCRLSPLHVELRQGLIRPLPRRTETLSTRAALQPSLALCGPASRLALGHRRQDVGRAH